MKHYTFISKNDLKNLFTSGIEKLPQFDKALDIVWQDGHDYSPRSLSKVPEGTTHSYIFGLHCTRYFTPYFHIGSYGPGYALHMTLSNDCNGEVSYTCRYDATELVADITAEAIARLILFGKVCLLQYAQSDELEKQIEDLWQ